MSFNEDQLLQSIEGTWSLPTTVNSQQRTTDNDTTSITEPPSHCWICLQTESEDEVPRAWKSPCPCNLRAHEDCLLEWITDPESTKTRRLTSASQVQCPQCKSNIIIARPKDYLVSLIDILSVNAKRLVLPAGLSTIFTILATSSGIYGLNAVSLVFGPQEADKILKQSLRGLPVPATIQRLLRITEPFMLVVPSWQALLGFPAIAPALVLSRSNIADNAFLGLPILYFAWHYDGAFLQQWPPSPGLSFALLPYLRLVYRGAMDRIFGKLEQQWIRAVQRTPREGETAEQVANGGIDGDDADVINIEIELAMEGEEDGEEDRQEVLPMVDLPAEYPGDLDNEIRPEVVALQAEAGPAVPNNAVAEPNIQPGNQAPALAEGNAVDAAEDGRAGNFVDNALVGREGYSISNILQSVLGALFLPSLSSLSGDLLYLALPRRWLEAPVSTNWLGIVPSHKSTTIFQQRWARSLIGGCIFIGLKDALMLYRKWRKAKNHAQRRIVNYVDKGRVGM